VKLANFEAPRHLFFSKCLLRSLSYGQMMSLETRSQKCSICVLTLGPNLSPAQHKGKNYTTTYLCPWVPRYVFWKTKC